MEFKDLFEYYEEQPAAIAELFADNEDGEYSYEELRILKAKCEALGYTFEYYLDAVPFWLRKIGTPIPDEN